MYFSVTDSYKLDQFINDEYDTRRNPLKINEIELRWKIFKEISNWYYNLLEVFSKVKLDALPKFQLDINYYIPLNNGVRLDDFPYNPLYKISLEELEVYWNFITENLDKGFIELSIVL